MIETARINRDHVPAMKRIEAPPGTRIWWDVCSWVKQRAKHLVERVIGPEGERQNRQKDPSKQKRRSFHMMISRAVFTSVGYRLTRTIFPLCTFDF
jgi:hypothetical protein